MSRTHRRNLATCRFDRSAFEGSNPPSDGLSSHYSEDLLFAVSASPSIAGIAPPPAELFDLVLVDEAHQAPAVSTSSTETREGHCHFEVAKENLKENFSGYFTTDDCSGANRRCAAGAMLTHNSHGNALNHETQSHRFRQRIG